jgi:hypothetical protein
MTGFQDFPILENGTVNRRGTFTATIDVRFETAATENQRSQPMRSECMAVTIAGPIKVYIN